jgi:hypothetical protein
VFAAAQTLKVCLRTFKTNRTFLVVLKVAAAVEEACAGWLALRGFIGRRAARSVSRAIANAVHWFHRFSQEVL